MSRNRENVTESLGECGTYGIGNVGYENHGVSRFCRVDEGDGHQSESEENDADDRCEMTGNPSVIVIEPS